ncbi:SUMO ligase MMS21 [Aspergillus glaucus CBS 516.65]|uniref:SP-RING-type domain-containing protein n=1 Tax=Aspergillus glaucus CBS 516.65 TaxID=1160497 RepID=A0A1L9VQ31_ASPGL|nr:hypothetical protein ASPGLDRAFT_24164 [Aspergillus glaucus CBS 516.65]OJJ86002.1 hypothetical protein ASPGLDRAFT_24164 [Aspergillus glaucus CBS 516.65]
MPTAMPTPSRHSRYSTTDTATSDNDNDIPTLDTQLPPYEPPLAPLTANSQHALANLAQSHKLKALQTHITHAVEKLGDSAAQVNERLTDARERYTRYMARKRSRSQYENDGEVDDDGGDEEDEEVQRIKRTEEQVHAITEKLESEMRGIVDTEVKAGGLISILADLGKEAETASTTTQRQQPRNTRRRRNPNPDSDEDEDEEDEDEEDEDYQETQQQAVEPPSQKLTHQLTTETQNWNTLSLTQRYSTNNTYIGFYRMVHDAKHPGDDIPPLPHASTWFRHLEDPSTAAAPPPSQRPQTRRHQSTPAEDDEDIAIESERVSLKCPLTLLTFQEPLTSRKCPHSFEKQAIMDMVAHSPMMVPGDGGDRRNRVRAVKCPVCSVVLTQEDLKRDAVLERRVRRMQRQQEEEDEDEDEDEDRGEGNRRKRSRAQRKSGITVASDDEDDDDDDDDEEVEEEEEAQPVRVKQEKAMSRAPSAL